MPCPERVVASDQTFLVSDVSLFVAIMCYAVFLYNKNFESETRASSA